MTIISESSNATAKIVYLDADLHSSLNFSEKIEEIEQIIYEGKRLYFEFRFGLNPEIHNFKDQMHFMSLSIAIATFIEKIFESYQEHIDGVFLYRGLGDFRGAIDNHKELREQREEFIGDLKRSEHLDRLFALQVLMEYLHKLAAPLPEEISWNVLLNFKTILRPSYQAELLAAYTFPYIKPSVKGALVPTEGFAWGRGSSERGYIGNEISEFFFREKAQIAILLPPMGCFCYDLLDAKLIELNETGHPYKLIPEEMLNESWHLIDDLYIFEDRVTSEGRRMLAGFEAAGGRVLCCK